MLTWEKLLVAVRDIRSMENVCELSEPFLLMHMTHDKWCNRRCSLTLVGPEVGESSPCADVGEVVGCCGNI